MNLFSEQPVVEIRSGTVSKMPTLPLSVWKPEAFHHYGVYPQHLLDAKAGIQPGGTHFPLWATISVS